MIFYGKELDIDNKLHNYLKITDAIHCLIQFFINSDYISVYTEGYSCDLLRRRVVW